MLHFGIPAYRLPREDLMKEIRRIESMGVTIVLNHKVDDVLAEQKAGGFDAVFIAIGAISPSTSTFRPATRSKVLDAVSLLRDVETGERAARSAAASWSMAAATPRWTPPAPRAASAPTRR